MGNGRNYTQSVAIGNAHYSGVGRSSSLSSSVLHVFSLLLSFVFQSLCLVLFSWHHFPQPLPLILSELTQFHLTGQTFVFSLLLNKSEIFLLFCGIIKLAYLFFYCYCIRFHWYQLLYINSPYNNYLPGLWTHFHQLLLDLHHCHQVMMKIQKLLMAMMKIQKLLMETSLKAEKITADCLS